MKSQYGFGGDKFLSYAVVYDDEAAGSPSLRGMFRWAEFRDRSDAVQYLRCRKGGVIGRHLKIIKITRRAKRP